MVVLTGSLVSCEEVSKPEIGNFELGYQGSGTAVVGEELHMDAEIVAEGTIDRIRVEIHPESEHAMKSLAELSDGEGWEFDSTYTKFSGLKNTTFHEHIEIPDHAEAGHYHFHFEVTDMEGYQSVYEDELELLVPAAR